MIASPPALADRGHHVMQHLVVQHALDILRWHPRLVEHRMHPDQPLAHRVGPEANRALPPSSRVATPGDADTSELPGKVAGLQTREEHREIVMAPLAADEGPPLRRRDARAVRLDEDIQAAPRAAIAKRQVTMERVQHFVRRMEEHPVEAKFDATVQPSLPREHGAPVVVQHDMDPLGEAGGQIAGESVEVTPVRARSRDARLENTRGRPRRVFARDLVRGCFLKAEGELSHEILATARRIRCQHQTGPRFLQRSLRARNSRTRREAAASSSDATGGKGAVDLVDQKSAVSFEPLAIARSIEAAAFALYVVSSSRSRASRNVEIAARPAAVATP